MKIKMLLEEFNHQEYAAHPDLYFTVIFAIFEIIALVVFLIQAIRKKRHIWLWIMQFILNIAGSIIGGLRPYWGTIQGTPRDTSIWAISWIFTLSSLLFTYLWFESLWSTSISVKRFSIVLILWIIPLYNFTIPFLNSEPFLFSPNIIYICNGCYGILGLFTLGYGLIIYDRVKSTVVILRLKTIVGVIQITLALNILAFFLFFIRFGPLYPFLLPNYRDLLLNLFQILLLISFLIITCFYLYNIDYSYLLPVQIYGLMIMTKSGLPIHSVHFQSKNGYKIETDLVSGLITAINAMFVETIKSTHHIEQIESFDAAMCMNAGQKIVVCLIGNRIPSILLHSIKRYTKEFEIKFRDFLSQEYVDISNFNSADELLAPIFPFFEFLQD